MRDQCPNADDRVEDVLGEFLTQFGSDFVVGLSVMTVSGCEAFQVRYGFNVQYNYMAHFAPHSAQGAWVRRD
jgi:hypothetical protein